MNLAKRIIVALGAGLIFFALSVVVIIVFGYLLAKIHGLRYVFHDAFVVGVRNGLYLGSVIAILMLIGGSRPRPPH